MTAFASAIDMCLATPCPVLTLTNGFTGGPFMLLPCIKPYEWKDLPGPSCEWPIEPQIPELL
jgi:hypothetical protein